MEDLITIKGPNSRYVFSCVPDIYKKISNIFDKSKNSKINFIELLQTPFSTVYSIGSFLQKFQIINIITKIALISLPFILIKKISIIAAINFILLSTLIEKINHKKITKFSKNEIFKNIPQKNKEKSLKIKLINFQKNYLNNPKKTNKLKTILRPWLYDKINKKIPKIIKKLNNEKITSEEKNKYIQKTEKMIKTMQIQCNKAEALKISGMLISSFMIFSFLLSIFPLKTISCNAIFPLKYLYLYINSLPIAITIASFTRSFIAKGFIDSKDYNFNLKNATINPIKETYYSTKNKILLIGKKIKNIPSEIKKIPSKIVELHSKIKKIPSKISKIPSKIKNIFANIYKISVAI